MKHDLAEIDKEFTRDGVVLIAKHPWVADEAIRHVGGIESYSIQGCRLVLVFKDTIRKKKTKWLLATGGVLVDDNVVYAIVNKFNNFARIDNWGSVMWYYTKESARKARP